MENEIWKDVKGYEGYCQVSNMGRVKSMRVLKTPKNGVICRKNAFLSTKTTHDKQYVLVALCRDGEKKQIQVHRLVAEAFIPNPKNLPCIGGIKLKGESQSSYTEASHAIGVSD